MEPLFPEKFPKAESCNTVTQVIYVTHTVQEPNFTE